MTAVIMIMIGALTFVLGLVLLFDPAKPSEKHDDFAILLQWERDGIFPRIYGGSEGPEWYEAEKKRRGIVVRPEHIVTTEEFNDPEYRRKHNR